MGEVSKKNCIQCLVPDSTVLFQIYEYCKILVDSFEWTYSLILILFLFKKTWLTLWGATITTRAATTLTSWGKKTTAVEQWQEMIPHAFSMFGHKPKVLTNEDCTIKPAQLVDWISKLSVLNNGQKHLKQIELTQVCRLLLLHLFFLKRVPKQKRSKQSQGLLNQTVVTIFHSDQNRN